MRGGGKANGVKGDDIVSLATWSDHSNSKLVQHYHLSHVVILEIDAKADSFHLQQLFLSDPGTKFSQSIGWTTGERTARYAIVVDHDKVIYAEKEPGREVTVSTPYFANREVEVAESELTSVIDRSR